MENSRENNFTTSALAAPKHILVATDLSESDYLLPHAVAQAKLSHARITLVHVMPPSDSVRGVPAQGSVKTEQDVRLIMKGMLSELESQGITGGFVTRHGNPVEVIREELSRADADRLIIGTHARGKLGQLALGSVAKELHMSVEVPVFTVGPLSHEAAVHFTPARILHPVSLNNDYEDRAAFALEVSRIYGADLTLLHVLDPDVKESINPARTFEWAQNALAALIPAAGYTQDICVRIEAGSTVQEILGVASQEKTDWIILGVDGKPSFSRFWDSTAYKVLATAPCPVLTLRHERESRRNVKTESLSLRIG